MADDLFEDDDDLLDGDDGGDNEAGDNVSWVDPSSVEVMEEPVDLCQIQQDNANKLLKASFLDLDRLVEVEQTFLTADTTKIIPNPKHLRKATLVTPDGVLFHECLAYNVDGSVMQLKLHLVSVERREVQVCLISQSRMQSMTTFKMPHNAPLFALKRAISIRTNLPVEHLQLGRGEFSDQLPIDVWQEAQATQQRQQAQHSDYQQQLHQPARPTLTCYVPYPTLPPMPDPRFVEKRKREQEEAWVQRWSKRSKWFRPNCAPDLSNFKNSSPEIARHLADIRVNNVCAKAYLGCSINLPRTVGQLANVIYDPEERLPSVEMRIRDPPTSLNIFANGTVNCVGARDENSCMRAIRKAARKLQRLGYPIRLHGFHIFNIVANVDLGMRLDIESHVEYDDDDNTMIELARVFTKDNLNKIRQSRCRCPCAQRNAQTVQATVKIKVRKSGRLEFRGGKSREQIFESLIEHWKSLKKIAIDDGYSNFQYSSNSNIVETPTPCANLF